MNKLKGNWNIFAGKLRQGFGKLIGDYWETVHGEEQELFGQIQKHTATEASAERALREWGGGYAN